MRVSRLLLCLGRPLKGQKSLRRQRLGESNLYFTSLLPLQPWDGEVCGYVTLANVSASTTLLCARRNDDLNEQKPDGQNCLLSRKTLCPLLPLCSCLCCSFSGSGKEGDEPSERAVPGHLRIVWCLNWHQVTSVPQENMVKAGNAVHGDLAKTSIWVRGASSRLFLGLSGSHALSFLFSWGPNVALKVAEKWTAFKISQFKAWAFAELS